MTNPKTTERCPTEKVQAFWDAQAEWSRATFGTDEERDHIGPLKHLAKEAVEAQLRPADPIEIADCLFLVFDAARRSGMTLNTLISVAEQKLLVNKARKWSKPTTDEPVEHVRHTTPQAGSVGLIGPVACRDLVCNGECGLQSVSAYGESAADLPAPSDSTARAFARNHGLNPDLVAAMNRKRVPQSGSGESQVHQDEAVPLPVPEALKGKSLRSESSQAGSGELTWPTVDIPTDEDLRHRQPSTPAPQAQEAARRREDFGPNGDGTTPGFFKRKDELLLEEILDRAQDLGNLQWFKDKVTAYARARVEQETEAFQEVIRELLLSEEPWVPTDAKARTRDKAERILRGE